MTEFRGQSNSVWLRLRATRLEPFCVRLAPTDPTGDSMRPAFRGLVAAIALSTAAFGSAAENEQPGESFFGLKKIHQIHITISPEDYRAMEPAGGGFPFGPPGGPGGPPGAARGARPANPARPGAPGGPRGPGRGPEGPF